MFSKTGNQDENLASVRATLIMALGCLSHKVNHLRNIKISKLHEILEKSILASLIPFIEKNQGPLILSL